jgi:hypothetical protein
MKALGVSRLMMGDFATWASFADERSAAKR